MHIEVQHAVRGHLLQRRAVVHVQPLPPQLQAAQDPEAAQQPAPSARRAATQYPRLTDVAAFMVSLDDCDDCCVCTQWTQRISCWASSWDASPARAIVNSGKVQHMAIRLHARQVRHCTRQTLHRRVWKHQDHPGQRVLNFALQRTQASAEPRCGLHLCLC